ncbi:MAG: carboxylesterase type, partial [Acidimicrobiia bacterium]|nr:carboxylesterase type [Acidimicrobiia bacterium]
SPLSAPVPMMIGTTRDEYSMFLGFAIMGHEGPREAGAEAYLTKTFGAGIEAVVKAYTADRPNSSIYDVYEAMATFGNVRRPTIEMVEAQLAAGGPVYVYRFDWSSPLDPSLKAAHGLDIPFFFDTVDTALATGTAPERAGLAQDMCGALVRFARSGNPNPDGGNDWPAYSLDRRASMLFGVPSTVADDPDQAERQAWALLG